jgi:hypothetical protein
MKKMRLQFFLLATLLFSAAIAAGQEKQSSIQFGFTEKDYGSVAQGELIKQAFSFTNNGTGVLRILNIGVH